MADAVPASSGTTSDFARLLEMGEAVTGVLQDPAKAAKAVLQYKDLVVRAVADRNQRVALQAQTIAAAVRNAAAPYWPFPVAAAQNELDAVEGAIPQQKAIGNAIDDTGAPRASVADPVDLATGQLVYRHIDFHLDGGGIDFQLVRTYRSQARYPNGPLGPSWDYNLNLWIREIDPTQLAFGSGELREDRYVLQNPRAAAPDQTPYFAMTAGAHAVVRRQGPSFVLRQPDGRVYTFEAAQPSLHRIRRIADRFGNFLAFRYPTDDQIEIEVNDPGRVVRIRQDDLGRIVAVADYSGRVVRYTYDDYDDLVAVTLPRTRDQPLGRSTFYEYSSATGPRSHQLTSVSDSDGRQYLEVEYGVDSGSTADDKVIRQRDDDGEWRLEYAALDTGGATGANVATRWAEMARPSGFRVAHWLNDTGGLLAKAEQYFDHDGTLRTAVTRFAYNGDGQQTASLSAAGVLIQQVYGRDAFERRFGTSVPSIAERQAFGNLLRQVRRAHAGVGFGVNVLTTEWTPPAIDAQPISGSLTLLAGDIVQDFFYEPEFQLVAVETDPRAPDDMGRATRYLYSPAGELRTILFPAVSGPDPSSPTSVAASQSFDYDPVQPGRLIESTDGVGHLTRRTYHAGTRPPTDPGAIDLGLIPGPAVSIAGLIKSVTAGATESNAATTTYDVNARGIVVATVDPRGASTEFTIGADDLPHVIVQQLTPAAGAVVAYRTTRKYSAEGKLVRQERGIQDDGGAPLAGGLEIRFYRYNDSGQVVRECVGGADPAGWLIARSAWDGEGHLRRRITPGDSITSFRYDARGLRIATTRGAGTAEASTARNVYDADRRLQATIDPRGNVLRYEYDAFGRVAASIKVADVPPGSSDVRPLDARQGHTTVYDYDELDHVVSERVFEWRAKDTYVLRSFTETGYDQRGRAMRTVRHAFRSVSPVVVGSAGIGALASVAPPASAVPVETWTFLDENGRVVEQREGVVRSGAQASAGSSKTFASDYAGRTVSSSVRLLRQGQPPIEVCRTKTTYDPNGNILRVDRVDFELDAFDAVVNSEVVSQAFEYDSLNRKTAEIDALGNRTTFRYDSRGLMIERVDPLGNSTRYEYDVYGRRILSAERLNASIELQTRSEYDADGNTIRLVRADSKTGDLVATAYEYDALHRRTTEIAAVGTAIELRTAFTHDAADNVVWTRRPNGLVETQTFDEFNRCVRINYDRTTLLPQQVVAGTTFAAFKYDALGRRRRVTNDVSTARFKYDSLGRAVEETLTFAGITRTIARVFDARNNLTELTYPSGRRVRFSYDLANRLVAIDDVQRGAPNVGRAGSGLRTVLERAYVGMRIRSDRYGNGTSTEQLYDAAGRLCAVDHQGATGATMLAIGHLHDATGNRRHDWQSGTEALQPSIAYDYDGVRRLVAAAPRAAPTPPFASLSPPNEAHVSAVLGGQGAIDGLLGPLAVTPVTADRVYVYDSGDNRSKAIVGGTTSVSAFNVLDQLTAGTYDLRGNPSTNGQFALAYDEKCRIVEATDAGSVVFSADYDALGRRVHVAGGADDRVVVHDGDSEIAEYVNGSLAVEYVLEGRPDGRVLLSTGKEDFTMHRDSIGSTRLVTDSSAAIVGHFEFDPYGVDLPGGVDLPACRYRFMGRERDEEIALYHFRARHYDPAAGTFLQRDPASSRAERSAYCAFAANPLAFVDPFGTRAWMNNLPGLRGDSLRFKPWGNWTHPVQDNDADAWQDELYMPILAGRNMAWARHYADEYAQHPAGLRGLYSLFNTGVAFSFGVISETVEEALHPIAWAVNKVDPDGAIAMSLAAVPEAGPALGAAFNYLRLSASVAFGSRLASAAAAEARAMPMVDLITEQSIESGGGRILKNGAGWQRVSLSDVLERHAGPKATNWVTETGKVVFENPTNGRLVIIDPAGYLRIAQPSAIGVEVKASSYLDLAGNSPTLFRQVKGGAWKHVRLLYEPTKDAFEQATHFLWQTWPTR
jgi:RHS repeat-associated protein